MKGMNKRIRILDIFRGFAVLGTLGTNIWIFAYLGDLHYTTTFGIGDRWDWNDFLRILFLFFVNGKFLGMLTIMFGVGLALKYQQALRKGMPWPKTYLWTAFFLIGEGFLHFLLVMEYDILMSYGITAILCAYAVKGGERRIAKTMALTGTVHVLFIVLLFFTANFSLGSFADVVQLYREGTWFEQIHYRLENFIVLRLEALMIIPMNLFLFLLGVRLKRAGAFCSDLNGKKIRRKLAVIGILLGVPLNLLIFVPNGSFDLTVRYLFAPLMALGYMGIISLLVEKWPKLKIWHLLEQVGKMSLSIYIMQNIICSVLFYGWGFALGRKLDSLNVMVLWGAICILQIFFSLRWFKRFRLGPMETVRKGVLGLLT